jgi:hypothetical protein
MFSRAQQAKLSGEDRRMEIPVSQPPTASAAVGLPRKQTGTDSNTCPICFNRPLSRPKIG